MKTIHLQNRCHDPSCRQDHWSEPVFVFLEKVQPNHEWIKGHWKVAAWGTVDKTEAQWAEDVLCQDKWFEEVCADFQAIEEQENFKSMKPEDGIKGLLVIGRLWESAPWSNPDLAVLPVGFAVESWYPLYRP